MDLSGGSKNSSGPIDRSGPLPSARSGQGSQGGAGSAFMIPAFERVSQPESEGESVSVARAIPHALSSEICCLSKHINVRLARPVLTTAPVFPGCCRKGKYKLKVHHHGASAVHDGLVVLHRL